MNQNAICVCMCVCVCLHVCACVCLLCVCVSVTTCVVRPTDTKYVGNFNFFLFNLTTMHLQMCAL